MDTTQVSQPLAELSTNTHRAGPTQESVKSDISSVDCQPKKEASYASPSDEIMSPCTKKLSDLKGKRFKNAGKPQSLFAKLGKKSYEQSASQQTTD